MLDSWSDEERFEQMYHSTYPHVVAYCRRRLPSDDVDDVVAHIYTVAWQKRDQLFDADESMAWLHRVGFNTISARYRTRERRRRLNEKLEGEVARTSRSAETVATGRDEVQRAAQALRQLSPKDQELIRLAAYEELTYEQIAQVVGGSAASVRSSLFRARKRLRTQLGRLSGGAS